MKGPFVEVGMSDCCNDGCSTSPVATVDPVWRRVLWIALVANGTMFLAETAYAFIARSSALQADALDFLGDAANYAVSLWVASMALVWRARAAIAKGITLIVLAVVVLAFAIWRLSTGSSVPEPATMGILGALALVVNVSVALMLFRFRRGDANMRSVWICSRNDAIGNIAVMIAAVGVFGTGTVWPDIIVAAVLATLGLTGGLEIVRRSRAELSSLHSPPLPIGGRP